MINLKNGRRTIQTRIHIQREFQVCSKCTMSKHQAEIRADTGRDEEQDEDEGVESEEQK
jgi:hypothetical protein